MFTIVFEDNGQDFLEWDVNENNEVIDCRPLQSWVWVGTYIHNLIIEPGDLLEIRTPSGRDCRLIHAVKEVLEIA